VWRVGVEYKRNSNEFPIRMKKFEDTEGIIKRFNSKRERQDKRRTK